MSNICKCPIGEVIYRDLILSIWLTTVNKSFIKVDTTKNYSMKIQFCNTSIREKQ